MADSSMIDPKNASQAIVSPTNDVKRSSTKYKILVVEDEPDARTMFVDLLESEGTYDVSSAVDGIEALAKAEAEKFDLVLLDIVMPNKDGIETLQDIKANAEKYGDPIVVMLTNISGDAAVEKAMQLGAAGYKLKIGTEPEELLESIASYLAGNRENHVTGQVTAKLDVGGIPQPKTVEEKGNDELPMSA